MKAQTITLNENNEPVKINEHVVLYYSLLPLKEFSKMTLRVARENNLPRAFAVVRNEHSITDISVFVKYGEEWFQTDMFNAFLIRHLVRVINIDEN